MLFIPERMRRIVLRVAPIIPIISFVILCIAFPGAALAAREKNSDPLFQDPGEDSLFSGFSLDGTLQIVGLIVLAALVVAVILRLINRKPQSKKTRVTSKDLGPPPQPSGSTIRHNDEQGAPRQNPSGQSAPPQQPQKQAPTEKPGMKDLAAKRWAAYSNKPPEKPAAKPPTGPSTEAPRATSALNAQAEPTFNQESFLEGARILYSRLQEAWAARDVDDIATFATPEMLAIIKEQAAKDPTPYPVRILLVNASFEGMRQEGPEEIATVRFETMLRHGHDENAAPVEVKERWYFSRRLGWNVNWLLDGIEQI